VRSKRSAQPQPLTAPPLVSTAEMVKLRLPGRSKSNVSNPSSTAATPRPETAGTKEEVKPPASTAPPPADDATAAAATKVQAKSRGYFARKEVAKKKEEKQTDEAAAKVQAAIRGSSTRKKVKEQKESEKAATTVQAHIRGSKTRKQTKSTSAAAPAQAGAVDGVDPDKAATSVQAAIRGSKTRKQVKEQKSAATTVQSRIRGRNSRKSKPVPSTAEDTDQAEAAAKLQAVTRGQQARKRRASLETIREAAAAVEGGVERVGGEGELEVFIECANALPAMDRGGRADPYVKFALNGSDFSTKVMEGDLNPIYEASFKVKGVLEDLMLNPLTLCLFDKDKFSKDDPMGEVSVSLEGLLTEDKLTFEKQPLDKAKSGTLSFSVQWRSAERLANDAAREAIDEEIKGETIEQFYINVIVFNIKEVASGKINDLLASKTGSKLLAGFASKRLVGAKGDEIGAQLIGKIGELLAEDLPKKLKAAGGVVLSADHVFTASSAKTGIHYAIIQVRLHGLHLHVALKDAPPKVLGTIKKLGLERKVEKLLLKVVAPKLADALEDALPKDLAEKAGFKAIARARPPALQWQTFQQTMAVHEMPGATTQARISRENFIGAGLPEFLLSLAVVNPAFVQSIDNKSDSGVKPDRPSASAPTSEPSPAGKLCIAAHHAHVAFQKATQPLILSVLKCGAKGIEKLRLDMVRKAGRELMVTAVWAKGLHDPRSAAHTKLSPFVTFSIIKRGCDPSGLSMIDPFGGKTETAYGSGTTFPFPSLSEVVLGLPGVDSGDEDAALFVEVRDNPPLCKRGSLGDDDLIGSAVVKLDKLVRAAHKAGASTPTRMSVNLSLLKLGEPQKEKAKPSAGTLRITLELLPLHLPEGEAASS